MAFTTPPQMVWLPGSSDRRPKGGGWLSSPHTNLIPVLEVSGVNISENDLSMLAEKSDAPEGWIDCPRRRLLERFKVDSCSIVTYISLSDPVKVWVARLDESVLYSDK